MQLAPHICSVKRMLSNLVHDLELPKEKAGLLGSRLQEWDQAKYQSFPSPSAVFKTCVSAMITMAWWKGLVFANDPKEWRLFIKACLKAVLHNNNAKLSTLVACASGFNKTYESMELLLRLIKTHIYNMCGDLKVVLLLFGYCWATQRIYTFSVYATEEIRTATKNVISHLEQNHVASKHKVKHTAFADPKKVDISRFHIKLDLMKNFAKGMDYQGSGFQYLKGYWHMLS